MRFLSLLLLFEDKIQKFSNLKNVNNKKLLIILMAINLCLKYIKIYMNEDFVEDFVFKNIKFVDNSSTVINYLIKKNKTIIYFIYINKTIYHTLI